MTAQDLSSRATGRTLSTHGTPAERPHLSDVEFAWIREFLHRKAGIALGDSKKLLVAARLDKRLRHYGLSSYRDYFALLGNEGWGSEATLALDLLTTNETYFFREPQHFAFLRDQVLPQRLPGRVFRVWSAASSSGEEAYSLAMLLAEAIGDEGWEVIGTDISARVIESARRGLYPLAASEKIPGRYLERYCLRGSGEYEGTLLIHGALRRHVHFLNANLLEPPSNLGLFDVIFLRNVMIYFDADGKQRTITNVEQKLHRDGLLIVSHSESLNGVTTGLRAVRSSIYRRSASPE